MSDFDDTIIGTTVANDPSSIMVNESEISSLPDWKEKLIVVLSLISASLSLFGSSFILYCIFVRKHHQSEGNGDQAASSPRQRRASHRQSISSQSNKKNSLNAYRRIMACMSLWDIFFTLQICLQPFLVPEESSQQVWAVGNDASCSALGFLNQLGFAAFFYNGALSIYYVMTIRGGMTEDAFRTRVEPWLHLICNAYPLITAVSGSIVGVYRENEIGPGCWVNKYPENCGPDPTETGETCKSVMIAWIFGGIPMLFLFVVVAVNNWLIYFFVRRTIEKSKRHSRIAATRAGMSEATARSLRAATAQEKRIQTVATHAFLYVMAFLSSQMWIMILRLLEGANLATASDEDQLFPILLLAQVFVPLQGFFNLLIYLRPLYRRARDKFPHETRWWAARRALWGDSIQPFQPESRQPRRSSNSFLRRGTADDGSSSFAFSNTLPPTTSQHTSILNAASQNNHYNNYRQSAIAAWSAIKEAQYQMEVEEQQKTAELSSESMSLKKAVSEISDVGSQHESLDQEDIPRKRPSILARIVEKSEYALEGSTQDVSMSRDQDCQNHEAYQDEHHGDDPDDEDDDSQYGASTTASTIPE